MDILLLFDILMALILVGVLLNWLFPGWSFRRGLSPSLTVNGLVLLAIQVIVVLIVWAAVHLVLGHPVVLMALPAAGLLLYGGMQVEGDPVDPVPPSPAPSPSPGFNPNAIRWRWGVAAAAWAIGIICELIKAADIYGWANIGIGQTAANDFLFAGIALAIIGGALQSIPTFPDSVRLVGEKVIAERRALLKAASARTSRRR